MYACVFGCLFGQNSIFCNFLVLNRHFYHNQRQNYCLLCLAPAFPSLAAAFCNTFHKVFLVPLSTSAQNHEKHQKNAKLGFSHASAIFFAEKHFVGCRYIYNKTLLTCTNDSPSKKVHFQNFHRPWAIWATRPVTGGASSPRFFSTSRPDRDTRFGPLASSAIALAVHQKSYL